MNSTPDPLVTPPNKLIPDTWTPLHAKVWQDVVQTAVLAGLDPTKFNQGHAEILGRLVDFLQTEDVPAQVAAAPGWLAQWKQRVMGQNGQHDDAVQEATAVSPIIISGDPGTGKTTFLYVLDAVLRRHFKLPDNVTAVMSKDDGQTFAVHKRAFNGRVVSLLSVRKWTELLHFYTWDVAQHGLDRAARRDFICRVLRPMRLIFADELEIAGYSPTIPDLARQGILVIGTSNQSHFAQLEQALLPPQIYNFDGVDLRMGSPSDAVVATGSHGWQLFERLASQPMQQRGRRSYQSLWQDGVAVVRLDFERAVKAAMLESEWMAFMEAMYTAVHPQHQPLTTGAAYLLLFDNFSLDILRTDYNAIIRFVSLFDAIEQVAAGVLLRHAAPAPEEALSRAAIEHMKVTIHSARGITAEIKQRTVVGIDRCTSRLGQAGHKAQLLLNKKS